MPNEETMDRIIRKYHPEFDGKRAYAGEICREFMECTNPASNVQDVIARLSGLMVETGEHDRCEPPEYYVQPLGELLHPKAIERIAKSLTSVSEV